MVPPEARDLRPPYFNPDGSYTRHGVEIEISKHIIWVPNHPESLVRIAQAKGMNIVPRVPEMPHGIAFLCKPNIETHVEGAKHNNNSEAEYIIDWYRYKADDGRENIIWLSRIPPGKGTSKPPHVHTINPLNNRAIVEHYLKVSGVAFIGEGKNRRLMNEYEVVPPNTEHYIETPEGEGAVFFILIEGVEGIDNKDIHQFKPRDFRLPIQ